MLAFPSSGNMAILLSWQASDVNLWLVYHVSESTLYMVYSCMIDCMKTIESRSWLVLIADVSKSTPVFIETPLYEASWHVQFTKLIHRSKPPTWLIQSVPMKRVSYCVLWPALLADCGHMMVGYNKRYKERPIFQSEHVDSLTFTEVRAAKAYR